MPVSDSLSYRHVDALLRSLRRRGLTDVTCADEHGGTVLAVEMTDPLTGARITLSLPPAQPGWAREWYVDTCTASTTTMEPLEVRFGRHHWRNLDEMDSPRRVAAVLLRRARRAADGHARYGRSSQRDSTPTVAS